MKRQPNKQTQPQWVKASRIAELFDCSVESVYQGLLGLDRLPHRDMNAGLEGKERHAHRYFWPAAVALSEGMLDEWLAEQRRNEQSIRLLRRA
jgi:hypothetical protein